MRYSCTDASLLEEMTEEVTEKHGLGYEYSHSVGESPEERREARACFWRGDLHWFSKAKRLFTVVRNGLVSSVTVRWTT